MRSCCAGAAWRKPATRRRPFERVTKQVARFGRECGWAPWDVDAAAVTAWLDRVDCQPRQRYAYRTSLRTFYRWALRTGRVRTDPTEDTSQLAKPMTAPDAWHAAIQGYRRHQEAAKLSDQTVKLRCYQLTRLANELPGCGPWEVTATDLVEWLGGHNWARGSVYSYRAVLRSFYAWAADTGLMATNPAAGLPKVRLPVRMARPAPEVALLAALSAAKDDGERLMLHLAADIGLRAGEIATVHTEDVQPGIEDAGWWLEVTGKGDKVRYLPLSDELAREIHGKGRRGWLFPGQVGGHVARSTVTRKVSRLLPDHWTTHTLRHRFATRPYSVDSDVFAVQRMLGHASPTTTQVYCAVPESRMRRLVDAVGRGA